MKKILLHKEREVSIVPGLHSMTVAPPTLAPIPCQPFPGLTSPIHQPTSLPIASLTQRDLFLHERAFFNQHPLHSRLPYHVSHLINRGVEYFGAKAEEFKKPLPPVLSKLHHVQRAVSEEGLGQSLPNTKNNMDNAMLSYSESESLHNGAFDMSANLSMSDSLLSSNASITTPSSSFDLFDSNSQITDYNIDNPQDLRLSPHHYAESSAHSFEIEEEDSSSHSDKQFTQSHALQGHSTDSSPGQGDVPPQVPDRPRGKGRPAKAGGPLSRNGATCPICSKHFNNSSALAKHKLTHSDERKYVCRICSKAFKRQDHLNGHMMTHESKKPFACKFENCDKSYCDARSLRRHIENHHQQDVEALRQLQLRAAAMAGLNLEAPINPSSTQNSKVYPFDAQYSSGFGQSSSGEMCRSPGYLSQVSPISPAHPTSPHTTTAPPAIWAFNPLEEPKPVQCTMCHRRFKNIPALNGHMRLHGGYFKKDGESGPPTKPEESVKTELMPPPPPKKDVKKPIIIVPTTSSVQSTIGVTTVNTTVVVLPSRAETTTINAITSTQADFGVCQTLTSNSEASATNVSLTGNQPANSLHLASSTADILNQHAMPVVTNEAMAQIHHENVGQIRDEQTWQPDALVSSDGTVEHSLFDDQQATAEPSGMLDDSVQSLSESIENNIIESFSQAGGVHQGSLQSISDGGASYQQHNQFMDGQPIGYQGNMTTISQRHLPPHPGTPLDSPAPHTPHPTTPAHALTPSHSMTPQPHTPCTPHTPNAHTPSHPLTPTHRQQQQSRYFLFPPRQQLQDTLSNPVYPQADHLQSPHPNTQALQSPHPQTQALQSPHPQAQALQSPHPQAQALQSPHPQAQALQSQHPQHGQVLQSPHPQQTQALQSPLPQTVQAGHPQVMQSPMHPPSHQPLQSPLPQQQNMLQNALPQTGPMNLPMAHQMQTSGMQSSLSQQVLHSPMPQTQVPLPQHHTPLQSPLVQPQNLQQQQQPAQQQAHIFNFGHQTHVTLQQQQQAALQQQSQDDQHFEMELQQQIDRLSKQHEMERQRQNEEAIQQVERKLLEDLENLEKEALHKQQQQAKFDLESDLPIIQLQPPPPPRFQRQQQQQQQQQMQQQQQQAQQMMEEVPQQVLQKTEDIAYPDRVPSVVSDSLDQIIDGSGDLSDLLSLNLDAVPSDRKRPAGGQLDPCQPPKRPCLVLRQPGKPTALPFKKQDSSDSDRQDGATEHDDDDDDTDGQTDDSQPSAASRPMSGPGPCHRPRSGKQMRLIEAANKQCATGSGGGGQSSSSKSSSDGQTGGSGAGASTSTPASSSHSTSSASGSASSGGASNGAGGSGGGGGNPNDGVFRNPSGPAPPMKGKKKHRPEPLIIPPHVNHFGFPSRLRSPRLRESSNRMTPPPYTPPPMLSPVRSGAGLFWTLQTPKSAPITPRLIRRASLVAAAPPPEVIEEVDEEEAEPPPETDIQPHVNIGDQYQAKVPKCTGNPGSNVKSPSPEIMMWDPSVMEDLTEEELQYYQDFACCAAIPGNGTNKEYALHLLYICKGNVKKAILRLMQGTALVPENHTLKSYKYQESDLWTPEEIEAYHQALIKCDKDFFSIAKELGTKTVKQCVQFYYLWKKVCTDEYRKLRQVRRKREQDELYNLRSRASGTQGAAEPSSENQESHSPKLDENFSTKQALNGHIRVHGSQAQDSSPCAPSHRSTSPSPGPPSNKSSHSEDVEEGSFPCKLCDRVFTKVKSRNAHMKSHRQTETEHRPSYLPSDEC